MGLIYSSGKLTSSRRGIFFSLAAIIFLAVLTVVISTSMQAATVDTGLYSVRTTSAIRERTETAYLPMMLRLLSVAALNELTERSYEQNVPLVLPRDFSQAMENRTWGGALNYPLANYSFNEGLGLLSILWNTTGTNITFTLHNVTIAQTGAFTARSFATLNYTLRSNDGTVGYNRTLTVVADIPLRGLNDSYYARQARDEGFLLALHQREFNPQVPLRWDTAEFERAWNDQLYMLNPDAPSIFGRLQDILTPSVYGVETLIDPTIDPKTLPLANRTSVDWEYFQNTQFDCTYTVNGNANLVVSYDTLTEYNITTGTLIQANPTCPPPLS